MSADKPTVTIYTDGGCDPNPGAGGWGVVLLYTNPRNGEIHIRELSGGERETTNNRMELTAAIEALRALDQPYVVEFYSDSQYLIKGVNEWMPNWKRKNFNGVLNPDLWQTLNNELARHEIHWHWVKGHAGNSYNERADQLAMAAIPGAAQRRAVADAARRAYLATTSLGNPGAGGWAILIKSPDGDQHDQYLTNGYAMISPSRLDLLAAIAALEAVPERESVQVFTTSSYLHNGITKWIAGWKKNNWIKQTGGEVKFKDLWEQLDQLAQMRRVQWVLSGDNSVPEWDQLKALALQAAQKQTQP